MLVDSLAAPELTPVALAVYGLARAPPRPSHVDHPRVLSVVLEDRMTPTPPSSLVRSRHRTYASTSPDLPSQRRLRRRINAAAAGTHATVVVDGSGTLANAAARSASNPAGAPGIAPAAAAAADDGSATL